MRKQRKRRTYLRRKQDVAGDLENDSNQKCWSLYWFESVDYVSYHYAPKTRVEADLGRGSEYSNSIGEDWRVAAAVIGLQLRLHTTL